MVNWEEIGLNSEEKSLLQDCCRIMRKNCLLMARAAGNEGFHFGASLSIIEIVAILYLKVMKIGGDLFQAEKRDRFILSKGHGVPAVYAVLERMNILTEKDLMTFKGDETSLSGHPSKNEKLGIEFSSGSLGQGLAFGVGVAMALKKKQNYQSKVYVLVGDGECNEGAIWEAALSAAKYQLDNLVVIVDRNHLQYDGETECVLPMNSLEDKWQAFGWDVSTIDGHDLEAVYDGLKKGSSRPHVIIADTIKGKGISFMENNAAWHYGVMTKEQDRQAWKEVVGNED